MIKCIHEECCWPECEKTCGLVPVEESYSIGASLEEGLIYHLQERIGELKAKLEETRANMRIYYRDMHELIHKFNVPPLLECNDYERVCKYGYYDCVCDPGYIRKHYPDWWKDLGMPTTCNECENGSEYDDEDK